MEVTISDIPIEGLHLEGELPASIFELDAKDTIRPMGRINYDVRIYSFEEAIVFSGKLKGPFALQCGLCLEFFDYAADIPKWSSELDLEERQKTFDLQEVIREDFLLQLPTHPRCDVDGKNDICPKADFVEDEYDQEPMEEDEPPKDDVWGALDELK